LLYTKLDAGDKIAYPIKKELYRRSEKVVAVRMWIRIAVAIILIAVMSIAYWMSSSSSRYNQPVAVRHSAPPAQAQKPVVSPANNAQSNEQTAATVEPKEQAHPSYATVRNENGDQKQKNTTENQSILVSNNENNQIAAKNNLPTEPIQRPASTIDTKLIASVNINTDLVNNPSVTYTAPERTTTIDNQTVVESTPEPSDKKGSFKSLLRRATRVIEKRTGIDPTNGGDELLIGAVAVKLK
jgi:hypothetical protein